MEFVRFFFTDFWHFAGLFLLVCLVVQLVLGLARLVTGRSNNNDTKWGDGHE